MNVLVVFTYNYSLKTWAESGTLLKELETYKRLSAKGINFTFLTFEKSEENIDDLIDCNLKVIPIYSKLKKSKFKLINYLKSFFIPFYFKSQLHHIDVIKQNQLNGSWISIILKYILKKPLFIRTGYDMYEFSIKENKNLIIKTLYRLLTILSIRFSDLYTISSKSDLKFLESKFNISKSNIKVRPNWVNSIDYKKLATREEKKILFVGRLEKQKNIDFIVKSFSNTEYQIDIVGDGSLRKSIEKLSESKNTKLNFLGQIENEKLIDIYTKYKFYISSSLFEGNPKSTLEALSAGCIVFASDIPNHREIIKNTVNGFLFSLSTTDFISIFNSAIDNHDLDKVSYNAIKRVLENNSIDDLVNLESQDLKELSV